MRRLLSLNALLVVASFAALAVASGCGDKDDKSASKTATIQASIPAAKSRIVTRGALAYSAFRGSVVNPEKQGAFAEGAKGRKAALARGASAVLFMVRQLGEMKKATLSNDKFRPLSVKIDDLIPRLGSLIARMRAGTATEADVNAASRALDDVVTASKAAGVTIPRAGSTVVAGG